jgi:hypothetical protein
MDILLVLRPYSSDWQESKLGGGNNLTYDLASHMVDLDIDLSPELTKASCSSASTSAFF